MRSLIFFLPLLLPNAVSAKELTIVADGRPDHVIAVSERSKDPAKISEAAGLLQRAIAKATGVELPLVWLGPREMVHCE